MHLKGKVAVVTGVSQGIGYETVRQLINKGCIVHGVGRTKPDFKEQFHFHSCDIRFPNQVESTIKDIFSINPDVHILINNAGLGYFGYLEDTTIDQWQEMYETNVNGLFYVTKYVLPQMKNRGNGHIINIASTAGLEAYPQVSAYCGTKFAVRAISQSLYKEVREFGVKVTCVYPGSVNTNFFDRTENITAHDYMLSPVDVASMMITALETPENFHQVNLEVRPLRPKGPNAQN